MKLYKQILLPNEIDKAKEYLFKNIPKLSLEQKKLLLDGTELLIDFSIIYKFNSIGFPHTWRFVLKDGKITRESIFALIRDLGNFDEEHEYVAKIRHNIFGIEISGLFENSVWWNPRDWCSRTINEAKFTLKRNLENFKVGSNINILSEYSEIEKHFETKELNKIKREKFDCLKNYIDQIERNSYFKEIENNPELSKLCYSFFKLGTELERLGDKNRDSVAEKKRKSAKGGVTRAIYITKDKETNDRIIFDTFEKHGLYTRFRSKIATGRFLVKQLPKGVKLRDPRNIYEILEKHFLFDSINKYWSKRGV